jgi:hypothetical protein
MRLSIVPALAIVLIPAAVHAQQAEVSASVSIGQPAPVAGAQVVAPPPPGAPAPQPVYVQPQPVYAQPQPVYGAPPAYGQPVYGQPYMMPGRRRVVTEYRGGPIPPGAILQTRRYTGLAVAGGVTFGAFWLLSALVAAFEAGCGSSYYSTCNPATQWLYAPVIGPFITAGDGRTGPQDRAFLIIDGVIQSAGAVSLVLALAMTRQELVMWAGDRPRRNPRPQWSLLPMAPGASAGMTLSVANF